MIAKKRYWLELTCKECAMEKTKSKEALKKAPKFFPDIELKKEQESYACVSFLKGVEGPTRLLYSLYVVFSCN